MVRVDRDRIEQVVLNLLSNSMEAMADKKEKKLHIHIKKANSGNTIEAIFSDTGGGIQPEVINRIFDPFFTTKSPETGTGLGLFVSYTIIKDHEGKIWAENNEWGGASFTLQFPVGEEDN